MSIYKFNIVYTDVPNLAPLPGAHKEPEEEEEEDEINESKPSKSRRPSGPRVTDPYSEDDTSTILLPVFVAVGAFFPLLFCLCKL
jgi:hypothetical protein